MNRIERIYSDVSRLGRETEMLDAVVIMLSDELLERTSANGKSQYDIIVRLIRLGFDLTDAVNEATGHAPHYDRPENIELSNVSKAFREAHQQFSAAAALLPSLPIDTQIKHGDVSLYPGQVVPQRIAEVVLTHEDLLSAWSIDEADPDSVLDAIEAMLRRMEQNADMPSLEIETQEGDNWTLGEGGPRVYGDRENLAMWLSRGETGDLEFEKSIDRLPIWA